MEHRSNYPWSLGLLPKVVSCTLPFPPHPLLSPWFPPSLQTPSRTLPILSAASLIPLVQHPRRCLSSSLPFPSLPFLSLPAPVDARNPPREPKANCSTPAVTTDWAKIYNRANSAIKDARGFDADNSKWALEAGVTRQLSYEKLARDVAGSLEATAAGKRAAKREALRAGSAGWTPNTDIVRALARRGIFIAKSTWPGAGTGVFTRQWAADPAVGWTWWTNGI